MDQEKFVKRLIELRLNKGVSARDMSLSLGQSAGSVSYTHLTLPTTERV